MIFARRGFSTAESLKEIQLCCDASMQVTPGKRVGGADRGKTCALSMKVKIIFYRLCV